MSCPGKGKPLIGHSSCQRHAAGTQPSTACRHPAVSGGVPSHLAALPAVDGGHDTLACLTATPPHPLTLAPPPQHSLRPQGPLACLSPTQPSHSVGNPWSRVLCASLLTHSGMNYLYPSYGCSSWRSRQTLFCTWPQDTGGGWGTDRQIDKCISLTGMGYQPSSFTAVRPCPDQLASLSLWL